MKKILIVEDDQNNAKALAIRLESSGYKVTIAPDATLGIASALHIDPDLSLLNFSLPGGNGLIVADRIQRLLPRHAPFMLLTASKQPGLRDQAQRLGAAGFFEKPYETDDLLAAIRNTLRE